MGRSSIVALISCVVCVFSWQHADSQGFAANRGTAAIVNGESIPISELQKLLQRERPPVHPLTQAQKLELRKMALDLLINDTLVSQFLAKRFGAAPQAQIEKELAVLQQALAKKNMSFQQFLKNSKQTEKQLRDFIGTKILWNNYVADRLPDSVIKPYYQTNKVFFDGVIVEAGHILLKLPKNATAAEKQRLQSQLLSIRQTILNGTMTFKGAARKYSDCPSKEEGGEVGKFRYKFDVAEPFAKAAFSMKVGQISAPVETEHGYHLIKVTARSKGKATDFASVKEIVRTAYAQEVQLYQSVIGDLRKQAKIQVLLK